MKELNVAFEPVASMTPKPETVVDGYKKTLSEMGVGEVVAAEFESRYRLELTRSRWYFAAMDLGMNITTHKAGLRLEIKRVR